MLDRIRKTKVPLDARQQMNFDFNWKFARGDAPGAEKPDFRDAAWRKLNLPHDWSIEGTFHKDAPAGGSGAYLPAGVSWYRKRFTLTSEDLEGTILLRFDGVMMNSTVYVNGNFVGNRPYGYSSFCYDATPYLREGDNVVSVKVDNSHQPGSRWYPGSGIYRHTYLIKTGKVHVMYNGISVTTPAITPEYAVAALRTRVKNGCHGIRAVTLVAKILDAEGEAVAAISQSKDIPSGECAEFAQNLTVANPLMWDIDSPNMYRAHVRVFLDDALVDDDSASFGIREFGYGAKDGFTINGRKVKIQGLCLHQNMGCMGIAVPERMMESNLLKLKRIGCNGIRLTHYPHTPEMLDLLDTIGFVAIAEAFDEWAVARPKTADVGSNDIAECKYGYAEYFAKWADTDLRDLIARDRNHPCVAFWSIGNEIPEQSMPQGGEMARHFAELCHRCDPTRPVNSACQDTSGLGESACSDSYIEALDVPGVNYVDHWGEHKETYYFALHEKFPHKAFMGTEHVSSGGIRGNYDLYEHPNRWYTMYYNKMIDVEQRHKFLSLHPYVLGDFMWTGLDYLGEAAWPFITPCTGMLDFCGFEKDGYYLLHSIWQKEETVLYIVPHWNYPGHEKEAIPVVCYTNCDYVELFVNGQSYGKKSWQFPRPGMYDHFFSFRTPVLEITTADLHLEWNIPYEPGELRAVGIKDGKVVAERVVRTALAPHRAQLSSNAQEICADGQDACQIAVSIVDENGTPVPDAAILAKVTVEGAGELLGTDNGSPFVNGGYRVREKETFAGMLGIIVRSNGKPGDIIVRVETELGEEQIVVKAR